MTLRQSYNVLNLTPGAPLDAARQVYRELATRWHPDRFEEGTARYDRAERRIKRLNQAYTRIQKSTEVEREALRTSTSAVPAAQPDLSHTASSHSTHSEVPPAGTADDTRPAKSRLRGWTGVVGVAASVGLFCWGVLWSPGLASMLAWTASWTVLAVGAFMLIPDDRSPSA